MIEVAKIPKQIVIEREAHDVDCQLRADVRKMQDAYVVLRDMADYQCPENVEELTTDAIDRLTEERINKALADDTLLPSEIEERIKKFKSLHRIVVTQLNIIRRIIDRWPDAAFAYDAEVRNITPTADLAAAIEKRCLREVPSIASQHGRLIANVKQAVEKLRLFEQGENVAKIRLEQLFSLDAHSLAGMWADGSIKKPVITNEPWMRSAASMREFQEKMYL